jgi:hypothetical protein
MIPSDHFVRFYNEVFKFLECRGEKHLKNYWQEISRHQELHCLELFKTKGLKGMVEYWTHIKDEENCDMSIREFPDHIEFEMHKCPSLSKVLDNDATPMERYCDHCAGWCVPLIKKAGFFPVFDIISRKEPRCRFMVFKNRKDTRKTEKKAVLLAK